MEGGVLGDADHGEDLLEVGAEAEGADLLSALAGGDHHLDDQRDAAGVQVFDLGKVQQDALDGVGQAFVGAHDGRLRGAGDVAREAQHGDGIAAWRGQFFDGDAGN